MQHLISITARPQPMNEWFDAKMDEAAKQVRVAEAAPELLAALQSLMANVPSFAKDPVYEAARAAINKATGGAA